MITNQYMDGDYQVTIHSNGAVARVYKPVVPVKTKKLVFTDVNSTDVNAIITGVTEAAVRVGYEASIVAKVVDPEDEGTTIDMTATFMVPVRATDGRERVVRAEIVNGNVNVTIDFNESGVWLLEEDQINRDLPEADGFFFDGFKLMYYS